MVQLLVCSTDSPNFQKGDVIGSFDESHQFGGLDLINKRVVQTNLTDSEVEILLRPYRRPIFPTTGFTSILHREVLVIASRKYYIDETDQIRRRAWH